MNPTATHPQWLFIAAAKGLQGYVLRSDPLKEMIGASELIERLPRTAKEDFLRQVLDQLGLKPEVLTDAAGAARMLFQSWDEAARLARLWPLLASQFAPGLEMSVAVVEVQDGQLGDAIETAEREINTNRNFPAASLPEAGPWVARNRRTGLPAVARVPALDEEDRARNQSDAVDDESRRKREAAGETAQNTLLAKIIPERFNQAFNPNTGHPSAKDRWTPDLTKLATNESSYLAIIHADANGLGVAMMKCISALGNKLEAPETYRQLCQAIDDASRWAAQKAMATLLDKTEQEIRKYPHGQVFVPIRPLVCAGEDFTCIIRAEHAVRFAQQAGQQDESGLCHLPSACRLRSLRHVQPEEPVGGFDRHAGNPEAADLHGAARHRRPDHGLRAERVG